MSNKDCNVSFDREATLQKILSLAAEKGFSTEGFDETVWDMSEKYRQITRKELSELDKYVVISQVLDVRLDDFIVATE